MDTWSWIGASFWICVDAVFFLLDMVLDVNTIFALLKSYYPVFAGCLTAIVLRSLFQQLLSGKIFMFPSAVWQSCRKGIRHEAFLDILKDERMFEAPASLALTAYSLLYCVSSASAALTQSLSLLLGLYGQANFLYIQLDLNMIDKDQISAGQDMLDQIQTRMEEAQDVLCGSDRRCLPEQLPCGAKPLDLSIFGCGKSPKPTLTQQKGWFQLPQHTGNDEDDES